ncbi:tetratricopeptide repeat protein [Prevotella sp. E13-17]|uniref:tetratricopeptide repeat protein n=1 Tax=Prevotella sp. E13-17 TaxID=2913616 RepID=UPI001EDC7CE8|nr:tetratricopeptide repeat protein [Prevotella sp. E13-17]UKK49813.1 tetratricopeptide repeat protein [Prevotella sp. E13-17]
MMNKYILFINIFILSCISAYAQEYENLQARKYIHRGNKQFHAGKRKDAQILYMKASDADKNLARAKYNLATAMFPKDWKSTTKEFGDSMISIFQKAVEVEHNPLRKSMGYHNIGVIYQGQKDFQKAIESYKNALRNNPNDDEARYNLVLCQRQLKNQPQQNQDNKQNQDKEQQNKQKQEQQKENQKKDQQNKQQEQEPPMSKENAEQLLKAALQQEKKTQERMKDAQQQPQRRRIEKNW